MNHYGLGGSIGKSLAQKTNKKKVKPKRKSKKERVKNKENTIHEINMDAQQNTLSLFQPPPIEKNYRKRRMDRLHKGVLLNLLFLVHLLIT